MEEQNQQTDVFTKANEMRGVFLTPKDAEEYRAYKIRKKVTEVALALSRSAGTLYCGEDTQRVCERAIRLKQAAIKTPLSKLALAKAYLAGSFVRLDCVVGGNGETLAKIKAYEARMAVKRGAKEITVAVTPSLFDCCRYMDIRKELKTVKRAIGKRAALKVRVEKINSRTALSRLARISSEVGAQYFSVPYFLDCERLRLDLTNGCMLETTGVETLKTYQTLTAKGVERIVTDKAWEIYNDWMREAQETPIVEREEFRLKEPLPPCATKMLELAEKAKEGQERNTDGKEETAVCGKKELDIKLL